jgi:hypothetical protein
MTQAGCLIVRRLSICALHQFAGMAMPEYFEEPREPGLAERYLGGWRVIASAWAIAMAFVVMFAGMDALASRHVAPPQHGDLAGVMIPRHDPSCGGPGDLTAGSTPNCPVVGESFARAEAEAQSEAAYGL